MTSIVLSSVEEARILREKTANSNKILFVAIKRIIDIVLSVVLAALTLILLPFIALAVKIESPGPIFFKQKRVGKDGKHFMLWKFRSTHRISVDETVGWGEEGDHIYTKVGRFLRKSYLDELPQIKNVLKGEMSLIGPRPERPEFVEILKKEVPFYELRLLVRPGLTGWAQINMENRAFAHEAKEKLRYDLYYIKHRTLLMELKIILKTLAMFLLYCWQ
ncbi:MAG: Exopolysaccharide biosynthesis polyprenyl glycosylphosphotransferase [Candidatus Giovannonibacteria bacterium GW2011_GWC2_44_8]|uniref:Exopolysaccharide biosynthesis polyprenyl glycosylphosphotransferase n=1 Tax=Candidatus Giovannonibacteria bacterium GW2011_GWC2_44_8 TaxID=1618657 RepID=A0A0G1K0V2_9BACT|nr:MAG: Exopolysaccharide biosynthesis polyprenyl glycosylphosphotransferase [Candidatus Giovannonibacteria bacterium GW2011_GWC2_44_8]